MAKIFINKTLNLEANNLELIGNIKDDTYSLSVTKISNSNIHFPFYHGTLSGISGRKIVMRAPFDFNWTSVTLGSDGIAGEVELDIWTNTDANFPPTAADTIFDNCPALNQNSKNTVSSFKSGKGSVSAGDWIICNVKTGKVRAIVTVSDNGSGNARFDVGFDSSIHGLTTGDTVTHSKFDVPSYNGIKVITVVDTNKYDTTDTFSLDSGGIFTTVPPYITLSCNINKI